MSPYITTAGHSLRAEASSFQPASDQENAQRLENGRAPGTGTEGELLLIPNALTAWAYTWDLADTPTRAWHQAIAEEEP